MRMAISIEEIIVYVTCAALASANGFFATMWVHQCCLLIMTGTGMSAIAVSGKLANILLDFAISIYLLSNVHQHFIKCSQRVHSYRTDGMALFHGVYSMLARRWPTTPLTHFSESLIENNYKSYWVKTFIRYILLEVAIKSNGSRETRRDYFIEGVD